MQLYFVQSYQNCQTKRLLAEFIDYQRKQSGNMHAVQLAALPTPRVNTPRTYRTHPDKLAPFWAEVEELLKNDSKLKAYLLFDKNKGVRSHCLLVD